MNISELIDKFGSMVNEGDPDARHPRGPIEVETKFGLFQFLLDPNTPSGVGPQVDMHFYFDGGGSRDISFAYTGEKNMNRSLFKAMMKNIVNGLTSMDDHEFEDDEAVIQEVEKHGLTAM